jgi:GrpB protein
MSALTAISRAKVLRVAAHAASWIPFLTAVAASMRGTWRVVGDGAGIALQSWNATAHTSLVGQATQLGHGLHDPGPLQYWLLAIPVHIDPVRGVLWGAALWCMAAASLAIEAAWSILGEIGGLLASGTILAMVAWRPLLVAEPYWNPCFAAMFFLAALAAGWAVMSGRRWWWPVLVITASVAAQAHLMFAIASATLVLLALIVGLVDAFRAKTGYQWAITGLIVGAGCWAAPFVQQFTSRVGNLTALVHGQGARQHAGLIFALKTLTAFTQPPSPGSLGLNGLIQTRSALFAVAILVVTAAAMLVAVFQLHSRILASLAAISLLASGAALVTFSRIPVEGLGRHRYLLLAMFPVGLLIWLTVGSAFVLTGRQVIKRMRAPKARRVGPHDGQQGPAGAWTRWAVHGAGAAAVPLIVLASVPGVVQPTQGFPGDASCAGMVSVATRLIEQARPGQQIALSVVAANKPDHYRLTLGLVWALTGDGYRLGLRSLPMRMQPMPHVTVLLRSRRITVAVTRRQRAIHERKNHVTEHVGSTAVPRLDAKPIVDLDVAVAAR